MKLLFYSHYFVPEGNAPASRTYEHCKRWVKAGHDVTVVTSVPNVPDGVVYPGWKNRLWPQCEVMNGIKVVRVWTCIAPNAGSTRRILNYLSYFFSATFFSLFFCRRPDVIIATSPQFFCGWAGVFSSYLRWVPLVLEVRDIWPDSIVTLGVMKKGAFTRLLEWMEKLMYRSANHIVTVTAGLKQDIAQKVPQCKAITVVTNGIDLERFPQVEGSPEFRQQHGFNGKFLCSYVGTVGMAHGLEVVLEAAKIFRSNGRTDLAFAIVGDGAERQRLQVECREQGLDQWVTFTGRIDKQLVPSVLASSDVLLIHLKKNKLFESAIPSKIFEAMAANKPLLVGVQGEVAWIIDDAGCGMMFEPENASELAHQLLSLADDPARYAALTGSGRDFVAANFSRDSLAAAMLESVQATLTPKN